MKPNRSAKVRRAAVIVFSAAALGAAAYGIRAAMRSPLFLVRIVEVADQPEPAPVDAQTINALAAVPVGKISLFDLDLEEIERRILTHPWIREVVLEKRFPQTLAISVVFREPKALFQSDNGALAYVDVDGRIFGKVSLLNQPDLPILTGLGHEPPGRVDEALQVLAAWSRAHLDAASQISSLSYDAERGYRALVTYPLAGAKPHALGRTRVELGHELSQEFDAQLGRLDHVFRYLATNGIAVRQIWADTGKKIVVKIARGS